MNRTTKRLLLVIALVATVAELVLLLSGCRNSPASLTHLPETAVSEAAVSAHPSYNPHGTLPASGRPGGQTLANPIPSNSEELWILARGDAATGQPSDDSPGSGALLAKVEEKEIPMPLKHTDVRASVSGYLGTVQVTQQFLNPYSTKIEAVYVFPLPHNAAINEFIMTIGERRIRGIIRERQEAEQLYQEARRQGYVAALLTEERPNVFTQSVANIEPGKEIDVDIKYFQTLDYTDGWYEFVFPMVVGPRFNSPGSTSGIGAVASGQTGASGQTTEVHYLRPGERTAHDISLNVDVDAGLPIEQFECKTHQITSEAVSPERLTISLHPGDRLPNRDFVLRYRVAGDRVKSAFLAQRDASGGFFTLMLFPPQELDSLKRQPVELVFVLDCSGSMSGRPIEQAKAAVQRGLRLLRPGDSFQLVTFSMTASQLGPEPLAATPENVQQALDYVRSLHGEGGTMMLEGIKAALAFPHDPERLRFVCFLTDGYVGNEAEILAEVHRRLGSARIFSFGIGSAVNRYLLDHLARAGHGAVAYLGPNDSAAQIMEDFFARISHPAMTDLQVDWGGLNVTEVFPRVLPDLFVGRPVILAGRFAGTQDTTIKVNGLAAGQPVQVAIGARLSQPQHPNDPDATNTSSIGQTPGPLPTLWARMKIADLAAQSLYLTDRELPQEIKRVALDYGLLSPFTAFIAVDSTRRTSGSEGTTVPVAVPVPDGVKYETTVDEH
jgi:Ca-activated chloride channel family protein